MSDSDYRPRPKLRPFFPSPSRGSDAQPEGPSQRAGSAPRPTPRPFTPAAPPRAIPAAPVQRASARAGGGTESAAAAAERDRRAWPDTWAGESAGEAGGAVSPAADSAHGDWGGWAGLGAAWNAGQGSDAQRTAASESGDYEAIAEASAASEAEHLVDDREREEPAASLADDSQSGASLDEAYHHPMEGSARASSAPAPAAPVMSYDSLQESDAAREASDATHAGTPEEDARSADLEIPATLEELKELEPWSSPPSEPAVVEPQLAVAEALERVAARVRSGEIVLPAGLRAPSEEAALALALAAVLDRGR